MIPLTLALAAVPYDLIADLTPFLVIGAAFALFVAAVCVRDIIRDWGR